jgi:tetratricopeptide (TPR) repeat protein
VNGTPRGDATVIKDIDASAPPGTPEMLDITGALSMAPPIGATRPMQSDPDGLARGPATVPAPLTSPAAVRPVATPPVRAARRIGPWLAIAAVALVLLIIAGAMLRRGGVGGVGGAARENRAMATAQPFVDRALAAKARGDVDAARRELTSALDIAPRHPVALREMGTLMYGIGNYDLARRFLLNAVRADPADRTAMQALGCSLVRLRRQDDAQRFFARAGGRAEECR